ncbi:PTS transporter subunit EIIC [Carnobacterium sp.]|uniref:PTS transporter subunit EIIC n=1 Tax=Carnobacterium sp. TaxID=48221 RepID=UPI0028A90428|nr:PTS transporter subunit EIIC [Carnobacterium sp.]
MVEKSNAQEVLKLVGGKENVSRVATCMTRLHISVRDHTKVNFDAIKEVEGVLGAVDGEVIQVVFGPGKVQRVGEQFANYAGLTLGSDDLEDIDLEEIARENKGFNNAKQTNPIQVFFKHFANVFLPLLPGIAAAGLINGISKIINLQTDNAYTGVWWYALITTLGWALFEYLPIFVGMNAAREFKGTPILGGIIGALSVSSISMPLLQEINEEAILLPFTHTQFDPAAGGILAAVLSGFFIAYVEKHIRKFVPDVLDMFLTPLIALTISGFIALIVIQPFGAYLTEGIFLSADFLLNKMGIVGSFLLSALQLPLVAVGLHRAFTPIHVLMNDPNGPTGGVNYLLPILQVAGAGQVGSAIALWVRSKKENDRLSKAIGATLPAGILGIGEPLMYGVTLPLLRPFICACIGSGFGGIVMSLMGVGSISQGVSGLLGFLIVKPGTQLGYLFGFSVGCAAAFVITYFFGYQRNKIQSIFGTSVKKEVKIKEKEVNVSHPKI